MSRKRYSNLTGKNNACQVICKEILHRNSHHFNRFNIISKIYPFLEENFCRFFSNFQALIRGLESCYFYFLLNIKQRPQRGFRSRGFSEILKAFAYCERGHARPTKAVGFYTPVYDRCFTSFSCHSETF